MISRIVVGLSAASGAGYGLELLKELDRGRRKGNVEVYLIYGDDALMLLEQETGATRDDLSSFVDRMVHRSRMDDQLASGSNRYDSMVIAPCSTSTVSKIHAGIGDNLMTRCASVALKERRRLILLVRETPVSTPVLRSMFELSSWGAVIMPASPPFYGLTDPSVEELQRAMAGRILDIMGLQTDASPRYRGDDRW